MDKEEYKTGQIWEAAHPLCWEVILSYVKQSEDGEPLFVILDVTSHMMAHNSPNKENYLYSPKDIDKQLGMDRGAKLIRAWNYDRWLDSEGKEVVNMWVDGEKYVEMAALQGFNIPK